MPGLRDHDAGEVIVVGLRMATTAIFRRRCISSIVYVVYSRTGAAGTVLNLSSRRMHFKPDSARGPLHSTQRDRREKDSEEIVGSGIFGLACGLPEYA